jgi:regulator of sigma E protease
MTLALLSVESLISILTVAIGLGMVIFFHELGHFAVAKWCNVQVERFSIGFGPILWSRKWGETEYALSAIPFGGYVKMLGQDDLDPGQETSEEVSENPRSYTAKTVPQRMAIISAGVIMNVITGYLFYVGALRMGTQVQGNEVGFVQPGMPAWEAGLREDDVLTSINGRPVADFSDVTRGTALTTGNVQIVGKHADGEVFEVSIQPDESGTKRLIGVGPQESLTLAVLEKPDVAVTRPGSPAARAEPKFQQGDRIVRIDGEPLDNFADLRQILTEKKDKALTFEVARAGEKQPDTADLVKITVEPQRFRSLGIRVAAGKISDIQDGSPADRQGLKVDDRILAVQGPDSDQPLDVGKTMDPLLLPDWFADRAGQTVTVTIDREGKGEETRTIELVPLPRRNWTTDYGPDVPLAIPAIGVAFHFLPTVQSVDPESPASEAGIEQGDLITKAEFVKPEDWPEEFAGENIEIEVGKTGWTRAVWVMQSHPTWPVKLTVKPQGEEKARVVQLSSERASDWYVASDRGLLLKPLLQERKAENLSEALAMGWDQTRDSATDIYLTLRGLFSGSISPKELHGPIGIFSIGMKVAEHGVPEFLIFLGFLSVNLAVLNFLPIPVLDGGHMAFLIWEGLARRRPSERVYATAMYLGMLFVLGLMGYVIYLDIMRRIV